MKKIAHMVLAAFALCACACSNDAYNDMPSKIQSFIAQYYPNSELAAFTSTDSTYTAVIKNGPTFVFASNYGWLSLNGNGSTLPQVFLFNELPSKLYNYLEETENTNNAFIATRSASAYTVTLLDTRVTYTVATKEIAGEEMSSSEKS